MCCHVAPKCCYSTTEWTRLMLALVSPFTFLSIVSLHWLKDEEEGRVVEGVRGQSRNSTYTQEGPHCHECVAILTDPCS